MHYKISYIGAVAIGVQEPGGRILSFALPRARQSPQEFDPSISFGEDAPGLAHNERNASYPRSLHSDALGLSVLSSQLRGDKSR